MKNILFLNQTGVRNFHVRVPRAAPRSRNRSVGLWPRLSRAAVSGGPHTHGGTLLRQNSDLGNLVWGTETIMY